MQRSSAAAGMTDACKSSASGNRTSTVSGSENFFCIGRLLVLNNTRVLAARRFQISRRRFLFLEKVGPARWKCLIKPGRKMRLGGITNDRQRNVARRRDFAGRRTGSSRWTRMSIFMRADRCRSRPISVARSESMDEQRYQTVFAQTPGALAAPDGRPAFHTGYFYPIPHAFVTLHVGTELSAGHSEKMSREHRMPRRIVFNFRRFAIGLRSTNAKRILAVGRLAFVSWNPSASRKTANLVAAKPDRNRIRSFIRRIDSSIVDLSHKFSPAALDPFSDAGERLAGSGFFAGERTTRSDSRRLSVLTVRRFACLILSKLKPRYGHEFCLKKTENGNGFPFAL